eukprot:m.274871 g.274871  ORF g.274871 m.274871 type:complete len:137 (+) comp115388_c0_seq1:1-411(+)
MYREQCIKLEDELCRLKEAKSAARELTGERNKKLFKRLAVMKSRYEALEKRRALEAEGYKNSIKMLQTKLTTVERQLYRLAARQAGDNREDVMLHDVKVASKKSKQALQNVQMLKSQIYSIEQDIRNVHSSSATAR